MGDKGTKSRKPLYGLIAIMLVACISLSVFLSLQYNVKAPIKPDLSAQQTTSTNPILPAALPSPTNSSQNSLITKEEAVNIAMPYIDQYATENNRTIANVTAIFFKSFNSGNRSGWNVNAEFVQVCGPVDIWTNTSAPNDPQYWIIGYQVSVYADGGEIADQGVYGIM